MHRHHHLRRIPQDHRKRRSAGPQVPEDSCRSPLRRSRRADTRDTEALLRVFPRSDLHSRVRQGLRHALLQIHLRPESARQGHRRHGRGRSRRQHIRDHARRQPARDDPQAQRPAQPQEGTSERQQFRGRSQNHEAGAPAAARHRRGRRTDCGALRQGNRQDYRSGHPQDSLHHDRHPGRQDVSLLKRAAGRSEEHAASENHRPGRGGGPGSEGPHPQRSRAQGPLETGRHFPFPGSHGRREDLSGKSPGRAALRLRGGHHTPGHERVHGKNSRQQAHRGSSRLCRL